MTGRARVVDAIAIRHLDKEAARRWVKALRSGRYKQGRGALRRKESDAHCCLGVACRVLRVPAHPGVGYDASRWYFGKAMDSSMPPDEFYAKLGITRSGSILDFIDRLVNLNDQPKDEGGKDFKGIADFIERELRL